MRKSTASSWVLFAAMVASGMGHAQTPVTLERDGPGVNIDYAMFSNVMAPQDYGVLTFSQDWLGDMQMVGATVSLPPTSILNGAGPGTLVMPLQSVRGVLGQSGDPDAVFFSQVVFSGGFTLSFGANFMSNGGSLTVSNLVVDVARGGIFADVVGGNGVGSLADVRLMDLQPVPSTAMSAADCVLASWSVPCRPQFAFRPEGAGPMTASSLGEGVFAAALGLNDTGRAVMEGFPLFAEFKVSPVPEPGTLASMMLGLSGMGWLALRRSRTSARESRR